MLTLKINQKNCTGQNNQLNYLIYFQSSLLCEVTDHIPVEFRDSGITDYNTAHFNPNLVFLNLCVILVFPSSVSLHFMSKGFYKISQEIERESWILQKHLGSQDRPNLFVCLSVLFSVLESASALSTVVLSPFWFMKLGLCLNTLKQISYN